MQGLPEDAFLGFAEWYDDNDGEIRLDFESREFKGKLNEDYICIISDGKGGLKVEGT